MDDELRLHKDMLAFNLYGWRAKDAQAAGVCIWCRLAPQLASQIDVDEYRISGLCPKCFERCTMEFEDIE